jgi:SAM-dependent methyltransferase
MHMHQPQIRFDDGSAYERAMGVWSQLAGDIFLDWLAPAAGQRWIDIGCGSGAFTEQLIQRCAPAEVQGIDPYEGQLAFARTRLGAAGALFHQGDAMTLPFEADRFDTAVMALVIFFVPEPSKGIAEMVRVVRPGGLIAAYAWDALGGGAPIEPIWAEMRAMGLTPVLPPSAHASRIDAMRDLWREANLDRIETSTITVQRGFPGFDEFWEISIASGAMHAMLERLGPEGAGELKQRVRARLSPGGDRPFTFNSFANAVKGTVPVARQPSAS